MWDLEKGTTVSSSFMRINLVIIRPPGASVEHGRHSGIKSDYSVSIEKIQFQLKQELTNTSI